MLNFILTEGRSRTTLSTRIWSSDLPDPFIGLDFGRTGGSSTYTRKTVIVTTSVKGNDRNKILVGVKMFRVIVNKMQQICLKSFTEQGTAENLASMSLYSGE